MRGTTLVAVLVLLTPAALSAQVGTTTDILTGVVKNSSGAPVAEAVIEATSVETQVTRTGRTDLRGRYTIVFPDGGGQYRLVVRAIGLTPVERLVARMADEDRLVTDITLSTVPQRLDEVVVRGNNGPPVLPNAPTPGSTERNLAPDQVARLPIDPSDLLLLASLVPGVVTLDATDTSGTSISVAGQRPTANNVTLDGLSFGSSQVPQEAVRNTRVITNSYDAARGQFSGGQIASTTRSGTNVVQGTTNYSLRDRDLEVSGGSDDAFSRGFTQHQLSGGLGGPVIRNKLFVFGSMSGRLRTDDLQTLFNASSSTLQRLGTSVDSANRFTSLLSGYGLPIALGNAANRESDNYTGLGRIDWNMNQAHTLTIRGDWQRSTQDPTRTNATSLPQTGGRQVSNGGGGLVTYTSRFGLGVINELKGYLSTSRQTSDPFLVLPSGRVQVASTLEDGSLGVSTLMFGGNSGLPSQSKTTTLEVSNETSWLPGNGAHRLKLGGLFNGAWIDQNFSQNRYGTFTFNSLSELEAGRPASFTRTLSPTDRSATSLNGAFYLADAYRRSAALQFSIGARVEYSGARGAPANNPQVETLFGRRTDALPSEVHVSPRFGFSYLPGAGRNGGPLPTLTIRGGIGEFRSPIQTNLLASVQAATGLAESQLICIGAAAPTPDWNSYLLDPSSIPTTCGVGGPPSVPTRSPTVTVFDPEFSAARAIRSSFGVSKRFGLYSISADMNFALGRSQTGFTDLNLVANPGFTLANEGNRPVFVPANTIVPETGTTGSLASRLHPEFGQVLSIASDLRSTTSQVILSGNGVTRKGLIFNASYTFSRSRDQSSSTGFGGGGFGGATTGGNPNVREWARSDFERKHAFSSTVTYPIGRSLEITSIARMTSGTPYTPRVGSDINGDGSRNDRAFIFNAATTTDTALKNGMTRLLSTTSGSANACLLSQLGQVAERNSCTGPWQPSLDLQVNWRPSILGLNRRLMVSVTTVNFLGGLDELAHGQDNLSGWGQSVRPDATLLYVRGFDPVTNQYLYTVNERFGSSSNTANAFRTPFQLGIQARYTIGPDRQRQFLDGLRGGGGFGGGGAGGGGRPGAGGGPGGGPGGGDGGLFSRFENLIPNPAKEVLAIRLGLRLTPEQVTKVTALSDSVTAQNKVLADSMQKEITKAGSNPDLGGLFRSIRPMIEKGQAIQTEMLKSLQGILTPEQWGQVPERIKNPPRGFGQGPGGAQRPGGDGRRP